jgi:antitoxin PrlF
VLSTITSKGQITIPIELRRATGLDAGMQVEFIVNARNRIELVPRHADIRALRGVVSAPRQAIGAADMRRAATEGLAVAAQPPEPGAA